MKLNYITDAMAFVIPRANMTTGDAVPEDTGTFAV